MTRYLSTPAVRCLARSRTFGCEQDAVAHARANAALSHVAFVVWAIGNGRLKQLAYLPAPRRGA